MKNISAFVPWAVPIVLLLIVLSAYFYIRMQNDHKDPNMTVAKAINRGDLEELEFLLKSGASPDTLDDIGNPPLVLAAATEQYRAANLLLDYRADIWKTDDFGLSAAAIAEDSRVLPDSIEGKARAIFIQRLKDAGYPWPPANPVEVMKLKSEGKWPPVSVKK
ncbi:hypothetical protein BH11PAT2_BH11PAT2_06150 [soil metagenome]